MSRYDLVIIGSGPACPAAAIQADKLKRRVLAVDRKGRPGRVLAHIGTIPSGTLRETLNLSGWRDRSIYGRPCRARDDIGAHDLSRIRETTS